MIRKNVEKCLEIARSIVERLEEVIENNDYHPIDEVYSNVLLDQLDDAGCTCNDLLMTLEVK